MEIKMFQLLYLPCNMFYKYRILFISWLPLVCTCVQDLALTCAAVQDKAVQIKQQINSFNKR
jgi:hypothetical protein